jgi:hypothetical protein
MVKAVHRAHNGRGSALRQAFALLPGSNSSTNHWLSTFTPHRIIARRESCGGAQSVVPQFRQLMKR